MELTQLAMFLKVVDEKGFSRAAHKVMRTQPAISMAIRRLESELGAKLLDRTLKEGSLTDAGKLVYEYAQKIDRLCQEMMNSLSELQEKHTGKLTIGANENGVLYLATYLRLYRQRYPGVKVEVRRAPSRHIPLDVMENELDLGVIGYRSSDPNLGTLPLYTDVIALIVYPDHRLAKISEVAIKDLSVETFIAHNITSPYRQMVIDAFRSAGVAINIGMEMPTIETIKQMIKAKMGISFLPQITVREELANRELVAVKVRDFRVAREILLTFPIKRDLSNAARAFLELVKETMPTSHPRVLKS
ncbi:MAG: LysR family transcriptional regulator [Acidobacteria bacterium]|nr:LysR family transcriptional regulator [Acidobacteriota bacterium]